MELEVLVLPHLHDGPTASSHWSRLSSRARRTRSAPSGWSDRCPTRRDRRRGRRRSATFSATRIGGVNACGMRVTPKPRRRFSVHWRERADDHLGRGGVRAAVAEVVLDVPGAVEAEGVGELDLLPAPRRTPAARPRAGRTGGACPTASARRSRTGGRASRLRSSRFRGTGRRRYLASPRCRGACRPLHRTYGCGPHRQDQPPRSTGSPIGRIRTRSRTSGGAAATAASTAPRPSWKCDQPS